MQTPSRARLLGAALLLLAAPAAASAQNDDNWSELFPRSGVTNDMLAIGTWNQQLVLGGSTLLEKGETLQHLGIWDGTSWTDVGGGVSDNVYAIASFQGDLYVGGDFTVAGGVIARGVARWDGTQWHALGQGIRRSTGTPARVYALEVYQGELYVGGDFDLAGTHPVTGVARWDGTSWSVAGGGVTGQEPVVHAFHAHTDGKLYMGGVFQQVDFENQTGGIAVWDGTQWSSVGGGLSLAWTGGVYAIQGYGGDLYAGGGFLDIGGVAAKRIARWDGSSWSPLGTGIPDGTGAASVWSMELFQGRLFVGGRFTSAGGVPAFRLASWDGQQWHGDGGVTGNDIFTTVVSMTVFEDRLYLAGEWHYGGSSFAVGEAVVSNCVMAYDGADYHAVGGGAGLSDRIEGMVRWNGGILAVGMFLEAGEEVAPHVAFFDGAEWSPMGFPNDNVHDVILWNGDPVITGPFDEIDGQDIWGIARWDGAQWQPIGNGIRANELAVWQGTLAAATSDGAYLWNGTSWQTFLPVFGSTYAVHEHQGVLYVGGSMFFSGGGSARLIAWDGSQATTFGTGPDGTVDVIGSYEGDLVIGGQFSSVDGVSASRLARWNGAQWSSFGSGVGGYSVMSLFEHGDQLFVGGNFGTPQAVADFVARWDGTSWHSLASGVSGAVFDFAYDPVDELLYVGGQFSFSGGDKVSHNLAAWGLAPLPVGNAYCPGNGCPCANDGLGVAGCANSTGVGAELSAFGSASVLADDLECAAEGLVPGQPALLFSGTTAVNGGSGVAFGDGLRCAGGSVARLGVESPDATGVATWGPGLAATAGWSPSTVVRLQVWYRDPLPSACGTGFNLSNGLEVGLVP